MDARHQTLPDPSNVEPLLPRLRQGDHEAFGEFVRGTLDRSLAVARRLLNREEDAQDAVQDAYVSAFRALPRFEGQSKLTTWLHRIVVNSALMRLRQRRRRPQTPIESLLPRFDATGHPSSPVAPWNQPPPEAIQSRENLERVRAAIDELPEAYRAVLVLRDLEGLDTAEAAAVLEVTPNTVKTRLHRARQALRALLEPYYTGEKEARA